MGSRRLVSLLKFTWVLVFMLSLLPIMVKGQIQGCSIEGIDLGQCLIQDEDPNTVYNCCKALNAVVQAGFYCLCSLLAASSSSPLWSTPLSLPLSNCYISAPPLTQCHVIASKPVMPKEQTQQPSSSVPKEVPKSAQDLQIPSNSTDKMDNSTIVAKRQPNLKEHGVPQVSLSNMANETSSTGFKSKMWLQLTLLQPLAILLL